MHTSERILLESARLFSLRGYKAVTMREIAARTGITAGALYNHYASKEAIRAAAYARLVDALPDYEAWETELDQGIDRTLPLEDHLFRFIGRMVPSLDETLAALTRFLVLERSASNDAAAIYNEHLVARPTRFFAKLFRTCLTDGDVTPDTCDQVAEVFNRSLLSASLEMLHADQGDAEQFAPPVVQTVKVFAALLDPRQA
jgi:TetR/AcrR family transcriptional repressor of uid operon